MRPDSECRIDKPTLYLDTSPLSGTAAPDQPLISHHNIKTLSNKQIMRIKEWSFNTERKVLQQTYHAFQQTMAPSQRHVGQKCSKCMKLSTPTSLWCFCSNALKWNARNVFCVTRSLSILWISMGSEFREVMDSKHCTVMETLRNASGSMSRN